MEPLRDIRILDLSRVLSGPFCSMQLADMGAEVIKVEAPGQGDDTRRFGPPFQGGESAYFLSINRNKRSITVNLKHREGRAIIEGLIERSDVLVENFRPGTMARLGLSYEEVAKRNPRLIYASISGFGHAGEERFSRQPGYDLLIQGLGGIASLTGEPDGPPMKNGVSIADLVAGLYAVQGILLALYAREKTGRGQQIDISMLDAQVSLLTYQAAIAFMTGESPGRMGNRHPTIVPYETFRVADGYFNLAIGNDRLWQRFCAAIGREDLSSDPDFSTNADRVRNRDRLVPILEGIMARRTCAEWTAILDDAGVPGGPILSVGEVLDHPQVRAREMVVEVEHPTLGSLPLTGIPVKLSETPGSIRRPPPRLGEHTEEVLEELLGYDREKIGELRASGAI